MPRINREHNGIHQTIRGKRDGFALHISIIPRNRKYDRRIAEWSVYRIQPFMDQNNRLPGFILCDQLLHCVSIPFVTENRISSSLTV